MGHESDDHHGGCYRISVSKISNIINRASKHIKMTPISVEEYLRNEVAEKDKILGANKLDETMDQYTRLYENE